MFCFVKIEWNAQIIKKSMSARGPENRTKKNDTIV